VVNLALVTTLSLAMALPAFGEFMYGRGLVQFAAPLMSLGFGVMAMRRLPSYLALGEAAFARGFLRALGRTTLLASVAVAVAAGVLLLSGLSPLGDSDRALASAAALIGLPGFALLVAQTQAARALGRVHAAYAPQGLAQPVAFAAVVAALWVWGGPPGFLPVCIAYAGTQLALAAIQAALLVRLPELARVPPAGNAFAWLREAAPMTLSVAAQNVATFAPLLILGLSADAVTVGLFAFYQSLMQGLLVINTAIFGAANPKLSVHLSLGRRPAAERLARRARLAAAGLSAIGAAAGWAGLMLLAPMVRPALSGEPVVLALLLAAPAVNALSGPLGHILIIEGRRGWEIMTQNAAAAATVLVCIAAIPAYGVVAAAAAPIAAGLVRAAITHALVFGRLGYRM